MHHNRDTSARNQCNNVSTVKFCPSVFGKENNEMDEGWVEAR